jgi:hypothetical protein
MCGTCYNGRFGGEYRRFHHLGGKISELGITLAVTSSLLADSPYIDDGDDTFL